MKKILFIFLITTSMFGQEFGVTKINVERKMTNYNPDKDNEIWIDFTTAYMMTFKQNPIGIKKAFSTLKTILSDNNLSFDLPTVEDSFLSAAVTDLQDFEMLDITIRQGSSEVRKIWELNGKIIAISLIEKSYFITIKK
jgi:hypothetical protein